jgi:hypothetical protein
MARAHFVKKAAKDYPNSGIKKGESYYWWQFRSRYGRGSKHMSKTPPKASQLTQSDFWSRVYQLQEREQPAFDDIESDLDDIKSEIEQLRDEQQEKLDNMPEGLQQGPTGEMLQERYDALDSVYSDLDSVDIPSEDDVTSEASDNYQPAEGEPEEFDELSDERKTEIVNELKQEKADEVWSEITNALENVSCS